MLGRERNKQKKARDSLTRNDTIEVLSEKDSIEHEKDIFFSPVAKSVFDTLTDNRTKHPNGRRYSDDIYKLAYILKYWYNPYDVIRKFLPFPCPTSLINHNRDELFNILRGLQNINFVKSYVENVLGSNDCLRERNDIVLSIDAIDIKLFTSKDNHISSIFIFYANPVDEKIKGFPVFALPHPSGKMTTDIKSKTSMLINKLNEIPFAHIPIKAVDGDPGYNAEHRTQFKEFYNLYVSDGFDALIENIQTNIVQKKKTFIITDMIHFGKNRRTQAVLQELSMKGKKVDTSKLLELLKGSGAVEDMSSLSKLQDAFPVEIFNFSVLAQLMQAKQWNIALFVFPMACWLEACLNTKLNKPSRLFLINCAFLTYMKLYMYQNEHKCISEMQP